MSRHEDEVQRNPYQLKTWLNYLLFEKRSSPSRRFVLYERAVKFLPRSYKLWFAYLNERISHLKQRTTDRGYEILINAFERCLVQLNKMPKIWLSYCGLMSSSGRGTSCRHVFDRALQALPITQHKEVWVMYIDWVKSFGVQETIIRVFRRYLMFDPSQRESFASYLESIGEHGEAATQLAVCLNDESFVSANGSRHQLWLTLCNICAKYPEDVSSQLRVESIIRAGIAKFSDEVGRLWCKLADFYARQGQFEKCRDIYEEALHSVSTVKDFSIVYDAYVKVEESILTAMMEGGEEDGEGEGDVANNKEIEMRLARIEYVMEKRPILLNEVVLRQNPHNVFEWHKRIQLMKGDNKRVLSTFMEAIKTVDPLNATGKLSSLWLAFAKFYEKSGDIESARTVFSKAVKVNFKSIDELANVWCGWGEMELRHQLFDKAVSVLQQAVSEPPGSIRKRKEAAIAAGKSSENGFDVASFSLSDKIHRNVKVWGFYLDLEESLGTLETVRAAYERAFELKVVTVQMALSYANYLEEAGYFEDSFRVYEQSVSLFTYPQLKILWNVYLEKFIARYGGTKMERLRDLFEHAIADMPADDCVELYIKYGKTEEVDGLSRHAAAVYDRATRAVPLSRKLDMYRLYVKKVEQFFGITKTRPIYERALTELDDNQCRELCKDFADMEKKLGEIDRARAILQHGSQYADPRKEPGYWVTWREFEENHGNEDTFREMLRIKRSVETANSQVNYLAAEMAADFVPSSAVAGATMESLAQVAESEAFVRATNKRARDEDILNLESQKHNRLVN